MRRLPAWLAALAAVVLLAAGFVLGPAVNEVRKHALGAVISGAETGVRYALPFVVSEALAAEKLEFKPVPPESAAAFERARRQARDRAPQPVVESKDAVPAPPVEPDAPSAPSPPVVVGRTGNIMRVGSDIHVETDQVVVGDVLGVGGDVVVDGHVEGDVVSMGGDVTLHSTARVDGDVVTMGGELHEDDGAVVGGRRVTTSGFGSDDWKQVKNRHRLRERFGDDFEDRGHVVKRVIWLIVAVLAAWLFAALAPGRTGKSLATLKREAGASLVIGLLSFLLFVPALIAVVVVMVLLCITIIGIPLGLALLFGYLTFAALLWGWGYVIGATAIGERVVERTGGAGTLVRYAVMGALTVEGVHVILGVLRWVPGFGGFATFLNVLWWGGAALLSMMGSGAWLRHEFQEGRLGRWWRGRTNPGVGSWNNPSAPPPSADAAAPASTSAPAGAWSASTPPVAPPAAPPGTGYFAPPPPSEPPPGDAPPTPPAAG